MRSDHVEIEARYSVSAELCLPSLDVLPGVAAVDPPVDQALVADYFDTDDLRLAWLGIILRRRTGGEDPVWRLLVPVASPGVGARYEVQEPLATDQAPPTAVLEALAGVVRRRRLTPLATITTRRTVHRLRHRRLDPGRGRRRPGRRPEHHARG